MNVPLPRLPLTALLGAALLAAAPAQTTDASPVPVPPELAAEVPALADQSSWAQDVAYEGAHPDKRMRGVYPVGNGHVFTYMGLGARANTMQAITGPHYQTDEELAPRGHFGEATLELVRDGQPVELPRQRVRRVRGASFVVTEDAAPGIALRTVTFAPPEQQHLIRVVQVENTGSEPRAGLVLRLASDAPVSAVDDSLRAAYESDERPAVAFFEMTGAHASGTTLLTELGELDAGESWTGVVTVSTATGPEPPAEWTPAHTDFPAATAAAKATLAWWKAELADTSDFDSDHRKLTDLVRDWKILMLVQRCAQSGVVAPMINHRAAFVRDSVGPMLTFLRFHMWDEARAILKYFYDATRLLGRVPTSVPLDLDFAPLRDRRTDWSRIEVPASEVPSWIILMHHWYWRTTQDIALISEHWPLIDACLKKQERGPDTLMRFHGDENYLTTLADLFPGRVQDGSGFIAEDPARGREAYSFASSVQFLMAVHAVAEMIDGLDKVTNPQRWAKGDPADAPGRPYFQRGLEIRDDIEKRYWLEDEKLFAPALSPVTGEPHRVPVANANLMPLWVGWTYPKGEKSRDNLRSTLTSLWRRGTRIGSTPTVGYVTGEVQGMLLTALAERDGVARLDCLDELLRMAEPAGEWGELYDPEGRPVHGSDAQWPNRLRPWESGINLEAIMFAISGIRFSYISNWDNEAIRLKLRLPHGAKHVTMKDIEKDARHIHLYMNEFYAKLDAGEREDNAKRRPERRLDPEVEHRRLRFRVELVSEDPPQGYWPLALNALNTVFASRYVWRDRPFDESMLWNEDTLVFLPRGAPPAAWKAPPVAVLEGADLAVLTARNAGARIGDDATTTRIDTGLPMSATDLARVLVSPDGELFHQRVFLDWGWNTPGPATFKTEQFFESGALKDAFSRFAAAGGEVLVPGFLQRYRIEDGGQTRDVAAPGGKLALPAGGVTVHARISSDAAREAVLRLGSGCGLAVKLNGESVFDRRGGRSALPDTDAVLVRLRQGDNDLEIALGDDGDAVLFARVSGPRGLPVAGVSGR